MRIFITGIAGFIGSHLAEALKHKGHDVSGIDNFNGYYPQNLKQANAQQLKDLNVQVHHRDLVTDKLDGLLDKVDVVYHAAAQPGISIEVPLSSYVRNNIIATDALLTSCARLKDKPRLFVNISTSSVYGKYATGGEDAPAEPISHYGVTKLAAEQLALSYARQQIMPVCSMRLFSVFGPRERPDKLLPMLINNLLENKEITIYEGSKEHRRSFSYVKDIVEGLMLLLSNIDKCNAEIFNLGSSVENTTGEVIRKVEEILQRKARIKYLPKRLGEQNQTHANISKAENTLSYYPQTELSTALKESILYYRQNYE